MNELLETDLLAEYDQAVANIASDRHHLRDLGVTLEAEARAGFIGCDLIRTSGRLYWPDPAGFGALILGVWADEPPSVLAQTDNFVLMDLIAFNTTRPDRWWYRRAVQFAVLGAHHLHLAMDSGRSITLHDTPLQWLQAECRGAVLLEWCEWCRAASDEWRAAA